MYSTILDVTVPSSEQNKAFTLMDLILCGVREKLKQGRGTREGWA